MQETPGRYRHDLLQLLRAGFVKGFGWRPLTDGAANAKSGRRRPKASKEGNRGKWHAVVQRALWGFEHGRRGERWRPAPLSGLVGDVAAHDGAAAGAGICLEP